VTLSFPPLPHWRFQLLELVDFDIQYAFKVFLIVRQDNEVIMQGGCAKQDIKIRNELPPPPKESTHFCKLFYNGKVESQQVKIAKK